MTVQEAQCEPSAVSGAGLDPRICAVESDVFFLFHSLRARDEHSVSSEDAVAVQVAKCESSAVPGASLDSRIGAVESNVQ